MPEALLLTRDTDDDAEAPAADPVAGGITGAGGHHDLAALRAEFSAADDRNQLALASIGGLLGQMAMRFGIGGRPSNGLAIRYSANLRMFDSYHAKGPDNDPYTITGVPGMGTVVLQGMNGSRHKPRGLNRQAVQPPDAGPYGVAVTSQTSPIEAREWAWYNAGNVGPLHLDQGFGADDLGIPGMHHGPRNGYGPGPATYGVQRNFVQLPKPRGI